MDSKDRWVGRIARHRRDEIRTLGVLEGDFSIWVRRAGIMDLI